ncbi:molybdenum cofactor guanylyltransferase MobA [Vibrio breoganii]|uniref:molybdenum cofactor guanylyltransferase MobA n=1 Tax=Vibrio breoganii TaxID=553239 RepID=UPI000C83C2BC|nr:molybdenum cofactor guanylyltransferase MobA [Vibrio breoganii]PMO29428.1 molybdenum cofactor guanylyltransferase MobA [Vibrio breoganii]
MNSISWVVLAGGQATRMQGQDKGLVELNDKPLIEYVLEVLKSHSDSVYINANRSQERYQEYAPVFADQYQGFVGPMGGIHAGLTHVDSEWVGFVPCDCPQISPTLIQRMQQEINEEDEILVAHDGDFIQPVFTVFRRSVLERLQQFLDDGERKIILFYDRCNTRQIDFSDIKESFVNLNSKQELLKFKQ